MEDVIRLRLVGRNIALGLGGIALGAMLMALLTFWDAPSDSVAALLVGLGIVTLSCASILGGSAALFGSVREECARCARPLERFTTHFSECTYDDLVARVQRGSGQALAGVAQLPAAPSEARELAALDYEVCPCCQQSGRITAYRMRWDPTSQRYEPYDRVEPSHVGGLPMKQLVLAAEVRGARPSREGEGRDEL